MYSKAVQFTIALDDSDKCTRTFYVGTLQEAHSGGCNSQLLDDDEARVPLI